MLEGQLLLEVQCWRGSYCWRCNVGGAVTA